MTIFEQALIILIIIAFIFIKMIASDKTETTNIEFKKLQINYFIPFFLATFADWIQGPYVYKVYKDYGYDEKNIALLYIAGFASSMVFGTVVGSVADKFGRKLICMLYGIAYSICCLTKFSPDFYTLLYGRVFGGIATSILFSGFESWYVNEHLHFYMFPVEWLNFTFARATFGSGLFAIVSGFIAHIFADTLDFGAISPFAVAVPFLMGTSVYIFFKWDEHYDPKANKSTLLSSSMFSSLKFLFSDPCLFTLGIVQSIYEGIMYTFIFAWTPVLEVLSPPLGLVFSCFMISLMIGSKIYSIMISKYFTPESMLSVTLYTSTFSIAIITVLTSSALDSYRFLSTNLCFVAFLFYEVSVGMYCPVTGYLRGRIIPEKARATITNWLRVPTNMITCFTLIFIKNEDAEGSKLRAIHSVFVVCTLCLVLCLVMTFCFKKLYVEKKFSSDSNKDIQLNAS
uniref:Molybdate-anion transporter n=2 Tax=Cacopsylla melanoneura TaxID=428564 RepID=A0A8D8SPC2_9HEMI